MTPCCASFFCEQWMKWHRFCQNASFHLKGNDIKIHQFPNQSSIFDLFNQVLNCNFDSIQLYPCQIKMSALMLAAIFTLVHGIRFIQFDPQLINKLPSSSIWPLIQLISVLLCMRLFRFGRWFQIFSIKSLIGHQTLIFMQLAHDLTKSTLKKYNLTPEL